MRLQERSFSGKTFRPKPDWYSSSDNKVLMALTHWGTETGNTKEIFEEIESLYCSLSEDRESTHPFPKLMSLNPIENNMRTAVTQANQTIYDRLNQETYSTGFELFFATLEKDIMTIIQIGHPIILVDSLHQTLRVVGQVTDLNFGAKKNKQTLASPLPYQLLGTHEDILFYTFRFRFRPEDRLILLNRNSIPSNWFNCAKKDRTLEKLSTLATEDNPLIPFWMAITEPD